MAKVSLRIYNREIESLIDKNQLDEAIAHCRHILQTFPKHLDTYRLLGKAYLESRRYDEAVDIFSRVLMSVPDDFVSHVGMSIIRDEQNKLDDAIWHMERAFESQPSNAAIQGELQRLFGRRDGMEPPKIRMTRGALAHMYLQGELYPQAISEIKAVLAQDSERVEMRYLLARAYFHAGQKADASDVCAQLLERYPYSFDANRIMVELLQGSENPQDREVYRQRVNELDPYAAFAHGSVFRSNEVPDETVSLEHLDYRAQGAQYGAEWTPPGIAAAPAAGEQPDWLREGYAAPEQSQPAAAEPAEPQADIPDFLRAAGWTESTGAAQEPPVFESFAEEEKPAAEIAPGEMPDWLKAMQPEESEPAAASPETPAEEPAPASDWLADLRSSASTTEPEAGVPDWLQNIEATEPEAGPASDDFSLPDWLKPAASAPAAADDFSLPDWLRPGAETPSGFQPLEPEIPLPAAEEPIAATTPPSLEPIEQEIPAAPAMPEGFEPIESETPAPPLEEPAAPAPEPIEPEIPAFIPPAEPARPAASLETLGTSAQEQADAMAWLESLAAKHGAKSEELVTDPSARSDKPPEWVEQAMSLGEPKPIIPEPEERAAPEPEPLQPASLEPVEEPVPFEFTEPVAAEHVEFIEPLPAESAELADTFIEPQAEEPAQPLHPDVTPVPEPLAIEETELTDIFIEPAPEGPAPEELAQPVEPEPAAGFFEPQAEESIQPAEPEPAQPEPEHIEPALDETGIWLRSLDQKGTPSELEHLDVFASETKTPAVDDSMSVLSDWAREAESPQEEALAGEKAETSSDLPDWLRGVDEEEKWTTPSVNTEELPAWLQAEPEPSPLAEPTSPADWHPADVIQEPDLTPEEIETVPEPAQDYLLEVEELKAREQPTEQESALDLEPEAQLEPEPRPSEPSFVPEQQEQESSPAEAVREEPGPEVLPERAIEPPAAPPPAAPRRPQPVRPVGERRPPMLVPAEGESLLAQAQADLHRGNIPASLDQYTRLIKRGKLLEEIIRDLRDALYRYPVEVTIWQTLGDAYMRENRLQEALDSYTKAEELLR